MAGPASLRRFHLEGVRDTGRVIGEGAYAVVKELEFRGLKCVGKKLHAVLYENASRGINFDTNGVPRHVIMMRRGSICCTARSSLFSSW